MTPQATRTLRAGVLGLLALVLAAVAWSLRKPAGPVAANRPSAAPGVGTTSTGVVLRGFSGSDQRFLIEAESQQGQDKEGLRLRGVKATFPYHSQGKTLSTTIAADECLCEPEPRRASFRGHVRVLTQDGLELSTEALDYRGQEGVAESTEDVSFTRGRVSGRGRGARYDARGQRLELLAEVRLRIEEAGKPVKDVQAGRAVAERSNRTMDFSGGVVLRQGADELKAAELTLGFLGDFEVVTRALAKEEVRLETVDGQILPGSKGGPIGQGGGRRLNCRKLDVVFRTDGTLQDAVATGGRDRAGNEKNAGLELLPDPKGPPERRLLQSRVIVLRFDEQGRLVMLQGQRAVVLTSEPASPRGGPPRTAHSDSVDALLDPLTGALTRVDLEGHVDLLQAWQRANAGKARYDPGKETLFLSGDARVVDEEQGSDLRAEAINLGPGREAAARGNVRHTVAARKTASRPGLLSRDEPAVFLAHRFDYEGAARTARYSENALLRSGQDEVRAPLLVLEEPAPGQRCLSASGGVASLLHPRPQPGKSKPPEPVETRSQEMVYDEAKSRISYSGDVVIRQGDIRTRSPQAVVTLAPDGSAIERLEAGEPVEVEQGRRKARGRKGTYTPRDETLVLVGEKVQLQDPERSVEGRVLTFHVGDDRIRIDGQEEVRTEAVFKREPPRSVPPKGGPTRHDRPQNEPPQR